MKHLLIFLLSWSGLWLFGQKSPTELAIERQGMMDVLAVDPSLKVSLMYTRADNFTGRILYKDLHTAYLHPEAARALKKAQAELKRRHPDLSLKVYDAARPMSVQQEMYNVVRGTSKAIYVSNPRNGGGLHNYGLAVDVTLCHEASGDTLPMGSVIDHLGKLAHVKDETTLLQEGKLSKQAVENRRLLREVMAAGGFKVLSTEWWHFNFKSRATARKYYKVIR
ncbi:MAG: M15 family metallopeptidase [Bacteroidaceae bacterium]|nr:M15 family metallopeptidase [Bacteroidaceae bacterium]